MIQLDSIGCLVVVFFIVLTMMFMGVALRLLFSPLGLFLLLLLGGKIALDLSRTRSAQMPREDEHQQVYKKEDPASDSFDRDAEDVDYKPLD